MLYKMYMLASNSRVFVKDELEWMCKEVVLAYFKELYMHISYTGEDRENPIHNRRSAGQVRYVTDVWMELEFHLLQ
jgi:hypothetical protein